MSPQQPASLQPFTHRETHHMTHPTRALWQILFTLGLLAQAQTAHATSSTALRPDNRFAIGGGTIEYRQKLSSVVTADDSAPHANKATTHFSSGATQLRQQVMEQRKARAGQ